MLESEGIEVRLSGEGLGAAAGELPADVVEVTLWVAPAQLAVAKSFIEHYQTADRPEWHCQQCGEMNEGQFEICWQCGWENDSAD
ncbi:DUF7577 domain-containing protein [Photobacterium sanctipauli]